MSKRNAYVIAACVVSLAAFLLLPSLTARASVLLLLVAAVLLIRTLAKPSAEKLHSTAVGRDNAIEESSQETFALGKLFEATMTGMREGLLVVDKDMKVVASNTAAHRLFNLSRGSSRASG